MMFDTERFINAVQAKPAIWKVDDKAYSNRTIRKQAWDEIAQEITESWRWNSYSERQKEDIVEELQKKWRNLRDYHIKLRKKDKVSNRKANYLNMLNFLDSNAVDSDAKKVKRSEISYDSDEYDKRTSYISRGTETSYEIPAEIEIVEDVVDSNAFQTSMLGAIPSVNDDPDRGFLISLLPDMKSMNERQKFKFKLQIMQLIDKLKYSKESENTCQRDSITTEEEAHFIFPKAEITDERSRSRDSDE